MFSRAIDLIWRGKKIFFHRDKKKISKEEREERGITKSKYRNVKNSGKRDESCFRVHNAISGTMMDSIFDSEYIRLDGYDIIFRNRLVACLVFKFIYKTYGLIFLLTLID